jgi:hypothetical protein
MATVSLSKKQPVNTRRIETIDRGVRIDEILPFRIRFSSIMIPAGGPGVVPPIPLQIIGYSNYIL